MSERTFRLVLGIWLVAALAFDQAWAIYVMIALVTVEALTNRRVPALLSRLRGVAPAPACPPPADAPRFNFEAERALRLLLAGLLSLAMFAFPDGLWWLPWLLGFALAGAGLSGMCPSITLLQRLGLR